jgi:hypothetical protein
VIGRNSRPRPFYTKPKLLQGVVKRREVQLPDVPMKTRRDERTRLQVVAPYVKDGTVLFQQSACEQLLGQIFNKGLKPMTISITLLCTYFRGRRIRAWNCRRYTGLRCSGYFR